VAGAAVSTKARAAVVCLTSGMGARRAAPGAAIAMAATHDAIATNSSQRRTKHSQTKPATTKDDEEESEKNLQREREQSIASFVFPKLGWAQSNAMLGT